MSCNAKKDPNGTWRIQYRWMDWTGAKKKSQSSLGNSLKMQQKNRPYKRIQQVGEKNVHFKIVQGNFPEKRA